MYHSAGKRHNRTKRSGARLPGRSSGFYSRFADSDFRTGRQDLFRSAGNRHLLSGKTFRKRPGMHRTDQEDERRCLWCRQIIDETDSLDLLIAGAGKLCAGCLAKIQSQMDSCCRTVSAPAFHLQSSRRTQKKRWIYIHLLEDEEDSLSGLLRRGFVYGDTEILGEIPVRSTGKRLLKNTDIRLLARKQVSMEAMQAFLTEKNLLMARQQNEPDCSDGTECSGWRKKERKGGSKNQYENHIQRNKRGFVWFSVFDLDDRQKIRLLQEPGCCGLWILYGKRPDRKMLMKLMQKSGKDGLRKRKPMF